MPDTLSYLILGVIVTALIMGLLIASFVVRAQNARKDAEQIEEIMRDEASSSRGG